ncbi:MAG: FAD-binding protein [Blautia sp.]
MRQIETDVAVIGAGPAGLSAASQAASRSQSDSDR